MNLVNHPFGFWDGFTDVSWAVTDPGANAPIAEPVPPGGRTTLSATRSVPTLLATTGLTAITPAPTDVTSVTSPLVIRLNWDSSVGSAPAGFMTDIIAVARALQSALIDAVTVTINIGYGEVAGNIINGSLGESLSNMTRVSYEKLLSAVTADATTVTDASVVESLPTASPVGNATYWVTTARAKALGLAPANGTAVDGSVGFGRSSLFTYGFGTTTGMIKAGTYDFLATVAHEFTEVMGRQMLTGRTENGSASSFTALDLLHYSAAGTRDFVAATPGYLSVDGGTSNLGAFNTLSAGDAGDWASSVINDPFDAFATSGVAEAVSTNDMTEMDAIGWDPASSGGTISLPPPPVSTPTGVAVSARTEFLASAQVNKGLAAKAALAGVARIGGLAEDTYDFALGGTGAGSFSLTSANNIARLSVGANPVSGTTAGKLYALTVTATGQTSATSSPAVPVNVVVGCNGNDVIRLASLSGLVTSAPSFIYSPGGIDTIDGTGMTGTVYFDSGTGADTMTGGAGGNVFEYGAAVDSTASAIDIITNFNVAVDLIDLLSSVAPLAPAAASIAAGSIGWRASGGNTFVYANTSNRTEALAAANLKIELRGSIALSAAIFKHL